ncbi:SIMPL domain-containing protein [Mycolicibacterium phlei]
MPFAARTKTPTRLLAAAALGLIAVLSGCDVASSPAPGAGNAGESQARQVTVVGRGEVQGTPDTLTINAGMEVNGPDAAAALNQTSQLQRAVIGSLEEAGVERRDINTSQVTVQPQYGPGSNITGYRASNTIDVKVRDLNNSAAAFRAIAETGGNATRINNITLAIEDDSQLVREARARAFNDAKSRAEQYALLAEMDLGQVVSISEVPTSSPPTPFPSPRGGAAAEMAAVPIEPGQQTVGFEVTVVFELETS